MHCKINFLRISLLFVLTLLCTIAARQVFAQNDATAYVRHMSWSSQVESGYTGTTISWTQSYGYSRATYCGYYYNCAGCNQTTVCTGRQPPPDPEDICNTRQGTVPFAGYSFDDCLYDTQVYLCALSQSQRWIRDIDDCHCPLPLPAGESGYDEAIDTYVDYVGFPPTSGIPGDISLHPCVGSPDSNSAWLPQYGDQLCCSIQVLSNVGKLEAFLRTSTYQGIAMNAPVPSGMDTLKDIVIGQHSDWVIADSGFVGDTAYTYRLLAVTERSAPYSLFLHFTVLDFGAEGDLLVRSCVDTTLRTDTLHFPHDYVNRFHSNADADGDGLTVWEENRGFINQNGSYIRTSPLTREILVIDSGNVFTDADIGNDFKAMLENMVGAQVILCNVLTSDTVLQGWRFQRIDFKQGVYTAGGLVPWNTSLTLPAPPYGVPWGLYGEASAQQVAILLDQAGDSLTERGHCNHQHDYGICGNAGMAVLIETIGRDVVRWQTDGHYLPPDLVPRVRTVYKRKVLAHEFGHAIDINDHCPVNDPGCDQYGGAANCPLQNPFNDPHLPLSAELWEAWLNTYDNYDNWGYLNDQTYNCHDQILYRP